jgi:hypothetical protein
MLSARAFLPGHARDQYAGELSDAWISSIHCALHIYKYYRRHGLGTRMFQETARVRHTNVSGLCQSCREAYLMNPCLHARRLARLHFNLLVGAFGYHALHTATRRHRHCQPRAHISCMRRIQHSVAHLILHVQQKHEACPRPFACTPITTGVAKPCCSHMHAFT